MAEPIPEPPADEPAAERRNRYIGQPFRRVDGRAKVTGRTLFADDLVFPRMVHMKLVRSTQPHARIRGIDLARARQVPGVLGFLTGEEMPETFGILPVSQDEHALCPDRVRFVGDPVVAVAATDEDAAHEAALARRGRLRAAGHHRLGRGGAGHRPPRIHDYGDERQRPQARSRCASATSTAASPRPTWSSRTPSSTRATPTWRWSSTRRWRCPRTTSG